MSDPIPTATTLDAATFLDVLARVKEGDFTARMPHAWTGLTGKVAADLNDVIIANQSFAQQLERVSETVGRQGRLSQRLTPGVSSSSWSRSVDSVNDMIDDIVRPTSEMQRVIGAVADGDLGKTVCASLTVLR